MTALPASSFHFISGLPRSGSTLLAALLRQNPALHANITSPVGSMITALLGDMSAGNESAVFFTPAQRRAVLRGVFSSYYDALAPEGGSSRIAFDTNRGWTTRLELLAELFPQSKMICCVRPIPWILDSVERLVRKNAFELSKIFNFDTGGNVYTRAAGMMSDTGLVGFPLAALKQAMHSGEASRIMLLPYDTLVEQPAEAMAAVYAFTGVEPFAHDFENVAFDVTEFDARLGTPGLHHVRPQVKGIERRSILPPDLWLRYEGTALWRAADFNTLGVPVACEPPPPPAGAKGNGAASATQPVSQSI